MFINNKVVDQFVSSTDKVHKGFPSTGYNVLVYTSTGSGNYNKIIEGEHDDDFINNAYAGIIQFNKDRDETHSFAASVFKYVGRKLDVIIDNLITQITNLNNIISQYKEDITKLENQIDNLQSNVGVLENINNGLYDISRANNHAPDGSTWKTEVHDKYNLKISSIGCYFQDGIATEGIMYGTVGNN